TDAPGNQVNRRQRRPGAPGVLGAGKPSDMIEPIWRPSPERIRDSNVMALINQIGRDHDPSVVDYKSIHRFSVSRPELFWGLLWDFFSVVGDRSDDVVVNKES